VTASLAAAFAMVRMLAAAAAFVGRAGTIMKSEIERRRHRRAVNTYVAARTQIHVPVVPHVPILTIVGTGIMYEWQLTGEGMAAIVGQAPLHASDGDGNYRN